MENLAGGNGPFVFLLVLSVILLLLHICLQAMSVTREVGLAWNAGARDVRPDLKGVFADARSAPRIIFGKPIRLSSVWFSLLRSSATPPAGG